MMFKLNEVTFKVLLGTAGKYTDGKMEIQRHKEKSMSVVCPSEIAKRIDINCPFIAVVRGSKGQEDLIIQLYNEDLTAEEFRTIYTSISGKVGEGGL